MKVEIGGQKFEIPESLTTAVVLGYISWMGWVSIFVFSTQRDIALIKQKIELKLASTKTVPHPELADKEQPSLLTLIQSAQAEPADSNN